jgi:pilus assembly protein Flp/PilA
LGIHGSENRLVFRHFRGPILTIWKPAAVTFFQLLGAYNQLNLPVEMQVGASASMTWNQGAMTMSKFIKMIRNNKGATAIEYGLIAALIAVAAIGALKSVGSNLSGKFNDVATNLT